MPVATPEKMRELLTRGHDLKWLRAASGWPNRNVRGFADREGYRFDDEGVPYLPAPEPDVAADLVPVATGTADVRVVKVDVTSLRVNPANPRERFHDIDGLAASIREVGLIQPIVVRRDTAHGGFIIVAGHRRHAAIQLLAWVTADVIVRDANDNDLVTALIENGQRAGLDPIEEARAMNLLKSRMGLSDGAIAKKIGVSQALVSGRISLLSLDVEEQEQVRRGTLRLGDAVPMARANAGSRRSGGSNHSTGHPHLGVKHGLAGRAKSRCDRLGHKQRGRNTVGGGRLW